MLNLYFKHKKTMRIRQTDFFAERGLIRAVVDGTGEYKVIPVRQWLHRTNALNEMLGQKDSRGDGKIEADLRRKFTDIVDDSTSLARTAQEQGMPSDPTARADQARRTARVFAQSTNLQASVSAAI